MDQKRIVTDLLAPDNLKTHNNFPKLIDSFTLRPKTIKDPDFITEYIDIVNSKKINQIELFIVDLMDNNNVRFGYDPVYVLKPARLEMGAKARVMMYIPRESPGKVQFKMQIYKKTVVINNQTYTPVVNPGESRRVSHNTIIIETNLDHLWDGAPNKKIWVGDILDSLDRLNKRMVRNGPFGRGYQEKLLSSSNPFHPRSNPMLGAYLLHRLLVLIKTEPEEWGMVWCPLAREHIQKLKEHYNIAVMREEDWLEPIKNDAFNKDNKLDIFFCEALGFHWSSMPPRGFDPKQAKYGYIQEAKSYHKMIASAYRQGKGVVVVGHADPLVKDVGKWFTKPQPGAMEIWGYTEEGAPEIVITSLNGVSFERTKHMVLDYSPLFILSGDRRELFKQFITENNGRLIKGLPKAFSDLQPNPTTPTTIK